MSNLHIYNSKSSKKEEFKPINAPMVGLYVCGPTVYNEVHLGNVRTFTTFDMVYRYLTYLGYKVRYVRNITDVGHIVGDVDDGEDKIAKRAKLEQKEPMEIVQKYTNNFHDVMRLMNNNSPSIEPTATGHLIEQIEMIQQIIKNGFAYESNGSVYFDVKKYNQQHNYGCLSGRNVDELEENTRDLDGQDEKRFFADFALWKKASPEHIMRWNSPWSVGFPGWHLECSAMSTKYLGNTFDIHGGGMDLKFPHHECEIAQNVGCCGNEPVNYWMHGNMLNFNGQKMSKSLGNSILPMEMITGNHPLLDKGYSAMTIRFLLMNSHYSSEMDISIKGLQDAEKGLRKLLNASKYLTELIYKNESENSTLDTEINDLCDACKTYMDDDFNTAKLIANLYGLSSHINTFYNNQKTVTNINQNTFTKLQAVFPAFIFDILGLTDETNTTDNNAIDTIMSLVIDLRKNARDNKDFATSDKIRDEVKKANILIKDSKDGTTYEIN